MIKRIFEIIEISQEDDKLSTIYDVFMMITILISIIPLAFVGNYKVFEIVDKVTVIIFIIDYLLRLITANMKLKKGIKSYIIYPFTPMAIVDLLSILPSITVLNSSLKLFKIFRLLRTFKVFRVFKAVRYSKSIQVFIKVFTKQRDALITVCGVAVIYILVSALIVLNVEPETFGSYFKAIYWATVSLTTVGYGDLYCTTILGQIITMISALMGIAVVAMPAGIITAGFMEELNNKSNKDDK